MTRLKTRERLLAVFFGILILSSAFILPVARTAKAQTQSETEQEFVNQLPAGYFNATEVDVTAQGGAIVGYATEGNISVESAFMTQQQEAAFAQTGDITNSIFWQQGAADTNGFGNYDALLAAPGIYYLVVYTPNDPVNITELYIINPNIDLQNSTTNFGVFKMVQPGTTYTTPIHVETLGSSSQFDLLGASTEIVQYTVYDNTTQTAVFTSPSVTFTNFTVYPTVSTGYNLSLDPGFYLLSVTDESPNPAYVYVEYNIIPAYVNPFILNFGSPSPTGIAAYGLYNNSGTIQPYKVDSSSIVGYAQVSALSVLDNKSGTHQASLQLNTVLQVNNTDGALFTYWPQNVLAFLTNESSVTYRNNVLNTTGDNAQLTNQSIVGTGTVGGIVNNGVPQTYYGNYNSNYTYTYTLPQAWVLYMNETVEKGTGILIQMGVRALDGQTPTRITWFDEITIEDPNVAAADFVVDGRNYTPAGSATLIGSYYDAELVFGGGGGGQAATLLAMKANLALFYLNPSTGNLTAFPSLYTFGDDTAEAVYNAQVTNGDGSAAVGAGTPVYGILTNDFNASLKTLEAQAPSPSGPTSSSLLIGAAILVAIIVIVFAVVLVRRRGAKAAQVMVPGATPSAYPATRFCGNCGAALEADARFCPACGQPSEPPQ
ncbi:MAG: thermopsin family protease [Thaumarchaeota archaeon]|nr:thermopsin family protease [Nitrososphaerota archaeon]